MLKGLLPERFVEAPQAKLGSANVWFCIRTEFDNAGEKFNTPSNRIQFCAAVSAMVHKMKEDFPDDTQQVAYIFRYEHNGLIPISVSVHYQLN